MKKTIKATFTIVTISITIIGAYLLRTTHAKTAPNAVIATQTTSKKRKHNKQQYILNEL